MSAVIAFQGEVGAYGEMAARAHFGPAATLVACPTFEAVFVAVESGQAEAGLIPIENSLAGSIHQNYDLLLAHPLHIIGEQPLRVSHCLVAHPYATVGELTTVFSHPQALAQCARFLRQHPHLATQATANTAASVRAVRESGRRDHAAIASRRAAEAFGMAVLAEAIEDDPANFTRFLALARTPGQPGEHAKTSLVFSINHQPGALFKALSVFALRDIDLTKIESRPLVGKPWEYLFYVDILGARAEPRVQRALDHLAEYALMVRVLGSYPRYTP